MRSIHKYIISTLGVLSLLVGFNNLLAQHNWSFDVSDFEKSGEVNAIIIMDGVEMTDGALGAFVGDECRGVAEGDNILFFEPTGKTIFYLMCYSNVSSGEIINFKYYSAADQKIYEISETVEFSANMRVGMATDPFPLTVLKNTSPVSNCPDKSSLEPAPGPITFKLYEIFSDPEDDLLTYDEVHSVGSNVNWLSDSVLEYTTAPTGTSTLELSASDGDYSVLCDYTFTIGTTNTAPEVTNPISLITLREGFGSYLIDLDTVFSDTDGDELSYSSVISGSGVVTGSISGSILTLSEQGTGNASVVVSGADSEYSAEDHFSVVVIDDGPAPPWAVLAGGFEYSGEINAAIMINGVEATSGTLAAFVGDECRGVVDGAYFALADRTIFSILCYSDSTEWEYLNFKYKDIKSDQYFEIDEIIEFKPDMLLGSADSPVIFNIITDNDLPQIDNPISDQVVDEHFTSITFDLDNVFSDPNSDILSYSAVSDDISIADVSISSGILSVMEVSTGTCNITVTASDGFLSIDDRFELTINEVNDPPVLVNPIPDQSLQELFGSKVINISSVFKDPEGETLEYSVSSDDINVVKVTLSGPNLIIEENNPGICTVSFCVKDAAQQVCDDFIVNVKDINLPPETDIEGNRYEDQALVSGFESYTITDICNHFIDPDDDVLTYSVSSSNTSVVDVEVSGCDIIITEKGTGIAEITYCAEDEDFSICLYFSVTVFPQNTLDVYFFEDQLNDEDTVTVAYSDTLALLIIHSAIDWEIETTSEWFTPNKLNIFNVQLVFDENLSIVDRFGDFAIRDTQNHVLNFVLQQKGKPDGIIENEKNIVNVYPNPVHGLLMVSFAEEVAGEPGFQLISTDGSIVKEGRLEWPFNQIDMRDVGYGVYLLKILNNREELYVLPVLKM